MKFAIGIPNCREGVFYRPQISNVAQLIELTQLAERLGYDAIWGADFMAPVAQMSLPENAKPDWYELMVSLSYLAAVTERIKLGAGVVVLPYRDPVVLAKQAVTLDHFSRGRFILGVGIGAFRAEMEAIRPRGLGHRSKMLEEHLEALHQLFYNEGKTTFDGRYYAFNDVELNPKPLQNPLPIQIAGHSPDTYRRVAKYATGLSTVFRVVGDSYRPIVEALEPHLEAAGRSLADIDLQYTTFQLLESTHEKAQARGRESWLIKDRGVANPDEQLAKALVTTPEQAVVRIKKLEDEGVEHFVNTMYLVSSFEEIVEQVQMFAEEVMPAFA